MTAHALMTNYKSHVVKYSGFEMPVRRVPIRSNAASAAAVSQSSTAGKLKKQRAGKVRLSRSTSAFTVTLSLACAVSAEHEEKSVARHVSDLTKTALLVYLDS